MRNSSAPHVRKWTWVVAGALVLAGFFAVNLQLQRARAARAVAASVRAVPVVLTRVERRDMPVDLKGIGAVQAFNTVTVKPLVGGQIVQIAFTEGQAVRPGEILARIDSRFLTAQLHQAEAKRVQDQAQLDNARRDLARLTDVAVRGYISHQQLDAQRAQVAVDEAAIVGDQAAIEDARVQLDYATVRAPIEGVTGIRLVDVGNVIAPSDPGIVVITQLKPIAVIFTLPADALGAVPAGRTAADAPLTVEVFDRDDRVRLATGTLALIDNVIDRSTNTVRLKALFDNASGTLRPGQFVNAHLRRTVLRAVTVLPKAAIQYNEQGAFAWVVRSDSTVEPRRISVGPTAENLATIEQGLAPGEQVVLDGQYDLHPGAPVLVRASGTAAQATSRSALEIP